MIGSVARVFGEEEPCGEGYEACSAFMKASATSVAAAVPWLTRLLLKLCLLICRVARGALSSDAADNVSGRQTLV